MGLKVLVKRSREIGPILRRFFINTLFDSTFTLLGIIIGSVFATVPDLRLIIGTAIASSLALGISSGVSVYESETLEREKKVVALEKALFLNLENSIIVENYKNYALLLSSVNFLTPLACCGILLLPFVISLIGFVDVIFAAWISVTLALGLIFVAGTYLARGGKTNPFLKGLRMVLFGVIAFTLGYFIQVLI